MNLSFSHLFAFQVHAKYQWLFLFIKMFYLQHPQIRSRHLPIDILWRIISSHVSDKWCQSLLVDIEGFPSAISSRLGRGVSNKVVWYRLAYMLNLCTASKDIRPSSADNWGLPIVVDLVPLAFANGNELIMNGLTTSWQILILTICVPNNDVSKMFSNIYIYICTSPLNMKQ